MNQAFSYIILGASIFSHLLPLIIGKRQNNALLWIYILTGFCFELVLTSFKRLIQIEGFDYHIIGNIYFITEFILIAFYYYARIFKSKVVFTWLLLSLLALYAVTFYGNTVVSGKGEGLFIVAFMVFSIIGLYRQLKNVTTKKIEQSQFFWVNTGFLLYAAGSLPIFITVDTLLQINQDTLYKLWIFRNVLNIIKNIIFAKALTLKE
ncbi:MAG TPA: hypothetical protein VIN07_15215 [Flavipsychrobacter sp.]